MKVWPDFLIYERNDVKSTLVELPHLRGRMLVRIHHKPLESSFVISYIVLMATYPMQPSLALVISTDYLIKPLSPLLCDSIDIDVAEWEKTSGFYIHRLPRVFTGIYEFEIKEKCEAAWIAMYDRAIMVWKRPLKETAPNEYYDNVIALEPGCLVVEIDRDKVVKVTLNPVENGVKQVVEDLF